MKKQILLSSLLSATLAGSASAVTIDFTTAEGYSSGTLLGQTVDTSTGSSVEWTNFGQANTSYQVDTVNEWIQYSNVENPSLFTDIFDSTFLGFDPTTPGIVDFTISLDWLQQGTLGATQNVIFSIRDNTGKNYGGIRLRTDGLVNSVSATSDVTLADISAGTGFNDFTMRIDTVNENLSFFANGSTIAGAQGLAFVQSDVNGAIGKIDMRQNFSVNDSSFQFRIDSMEISQIPEPGAFAALAGVAALGLAMVRRRRR